MLVSIKTTEDLLPNFIQFLKTQNKSLPRRASMKATIGRLSTKKRGRGRIISLLIRVFSGHTPDEIIAANIDFIEKIGLNSHLSQTRANGLLSMIKQIKIYALAYQAKN